MNNLRAPFAVMMVFVPAQIVGLLTVMVGDDPLPVLTEQVTVVTQALLSVIVTV
jgi:hypothetical protein